MTYLKVPNDHGDSDVISVGNGRDGDDTGSYNGGSSVGNVCYGHDADGDNDGSNVGNTGDNNAVHGDSDSGGDCDDLEEDDDE